MRLTSPFEIAPNLEAGIRIGSDWITIVYADRSGDESRTRYTCTLLVGNREYTADDLQSGNASNADLQGGMESLLSFLGAAGEAYRYTMRGNESDNADLFPDWVMEWCYQHSDEISMMQCQIEETADLIAE